MPLFHVNDFSKGMTDDYLTSDPKSGKLFNNVVISELRSLDQRAGLVQFGDMASQIPPGLQSIDGAYMFDGVLFVKSGKRLYYNEGSSWVHLSSNVGSKDAFIDSEAGSQVSWSEWNGHLFITAGPTSNIRSGSQTVKVYRNTSSGWNLIQAGLPPAYGNGTWDNAFAGGGSGFYVYQYYAIFVLEYDAVVDGETLSFRDESKSAFQVTYKSSAPFRDNGFDYIAWDNFITYANTANEMYDTANMKWELYRTAANSYLPKLVTSGALNAYCIDNKKDIDLGIPLYTGDTRNTILGNDKVPKAFFSDIIDSRMVFLGCEDIDSEEFQFDAVRESKVNDPDSVPAGNFCKIEGKGTGLSHVGVHPVAMTINKTYRIEGHYDSFGTGLMRSRLISESDGCLSNKGILKTKDFIMFPSLNGFCYSDAYKVVNLVDTHLKDRYQSLLNKQNISAVYHTGESRAYFAVESPNRLPSGRNNELWVLDSKWSSRQRASFVTCSMSDENLQANDLFYDKMTGTLLLADNRGYVAAFDSDATCDIIIPDTGDLDPTKTIPIICHYISTAVRASQRRFSIWVTHLFCNFNNLSGSLSLDFEGYDDDKSTGYSLQSLRQRGISGIHKVKRMWRNGYLSSVYKMFGVKSGRVNLVWSDSYSLGNLVSGVVTLVSGVWPNYGAYDLVGYYIYFDTDDYTVGYRISSQSGAAIEIDSPPLDASGLAWEVRGVPKDEGFSIESVSLEYQELGEHYRGHRSSDDGGNS